MKIKLVKKTPLGGNITTFWFEPETPVQYIAGQYIELFLPHSNPDERKARRWFTLSSSPTEELLAITTRLIEPRRSTFKTALSNLKVGDEIKMLPPMGDFVLPKDETLPLMFIVAGIGVTPFRSMLKFLLDKDKRLDITVIYVPTRADEMIFSEILKKGSKKFIHHSGRLGGQDILDYSGKLSNHIIYLAGPERMVENIQNDLIMAGVNQTQIRTDFFHNYD